MTRLLWLCFIGRNNCKLQIANWSQWECELWIVNKNWNINSGKSWIRSFVCFVCWVVPLWLLCRSLHISNENLIWKPIEQNKCAKFIRATSKCLLIHSKRGETERKCASCKWQQSPGNAFQLQQSFADTPIVDNHRMIFQMIMCKCNQSNLLPNLGSCDQCFE